MALIVVIKAMFLLQLTSFMYATPGYDGGAGGGNDVISELLVAGSETSDFCDGSPIGQNVCLFCDALGLRSGLLCCSERQTFRGCAQVTEWFLELYTDDGGGGGAPPSSSVQKRAPNPASAAADYVPVRIAGGRGSPILDRLVDSVRRLARRKSRD